MVGCLGFCARKTYVINQRRQGGTGSSSKYNGEEKISLSGSVTKISEEFSTQRNETKIPVQNKNDQKITNHVSPKATTSTISQNSHTLNKNNDTIVTEPVSKNESKTTTTKSNTVINDTEKSKISTTSSRNENPKAVRKPKSNIAPPVPKITNEIWPETLTTSASNVGKEKELVLNENYISNAEIKNEYEAIAPQNATTESNFNVREITTKKEKQSSKVSVPIQNTSKDNIDSLQPRNDYKNDGLEDDIEEKKTVPIAPKNVTTNFNVQEKSVEVVREEVTKSSNTRPLSESEVSVSSQITNKGAKVNLDNSQLKNVNRNARLEDDIEEEKTVPIAPKNVTTNSNFIVQEKSVEVMREEVTKSTNLSEPEVSVSSQITRKSAKVHLDSSQLKNDHGNASLEEEFEEVSIESNFSAQEESMLVTRNINTTVNKDQKSFDPVQTSVNVEHSNSLQVPVNIDNVSSEVMHLEVPKKLHVNNNENTLTRLENNSEEYEPPTQVLTVNENTLNRTEKVSSVITTVNITKHHKSVNKSIENGVDSLIASNVINGGDNHETSEEQSKKEKEKRRSGVVPLPVEYDQNLHDKLKVYPKDPDDENIIRTAIEKNDFLSKIIKKKIMDDIIAAMYSKEVSARETIIKQGDKGSHVYISAKGKYQILIKGKLVGEFNDVRVFGELAILYNAKRQATIRSVTAGRMWVLDQKVYQQIIYRYNIKEQDEIMEFLMNNEKLNVAGKEVLQVVANLLKKEFFVSGKEIVKQGDKGNTFYIIRAGTVTITKDGEGVVGVYKKGDCFGELALLKEDCRQATVTADPPGVECLTLTRKEFINNFGELDSWKDAKVDTKKDSLQMSPISEYADLNINDLKIRKTLGVGGFGRVELVQHTKQKDLVFALKYLKKIDIVLQHQQEHVYNEKTVQIASRSPFIVRLYRTFKDDKYIYFLMEACLGGDLWSLLQKQKNRRFEEKDARFICACVLEAFEYLHVRGIIYRDLKPENLLISENGYIKLTDFGFAKKMTNARGKTFTFAGTPEYVAPEIVLSRGHDRAVDYWAYGAFVFEMLTGRTPFRTDDSSHMRTYNKILSGIDSVPFPNYVSPKARHLIEKLCRPVPAERLGMQRGGIKDIKSHRWYLGFDWQKFAKCEIPSPFKPRLRNPIDTKYFDEFKKDDDVPPDEKSGWDKTF